MAANATILVDHNGPSVLSSAAFAGDHHFREAFTKIDGMRKTGALLCDVTVVFGNGSQIKVGELGNVLLFLCRFYLRPVFHLSTTLFTTFYLHYHLLPPIPCF